MLFGFTVTIASEKTGVMSSWLSVGVNGSNPSFRGAEVPALVRPKIISAVEGAMRIRID